MIRIFTISLSIACALFLLRTGVNNSEVRAQNGFYDSTSHVPPSPSQPLSPGYNLTPLRPVAATVGTPPPAVATTPQTAAMKAPPFAYSPARPRNMPQYQQRPGTNLYDPVRPAITARPSTYTPANPVANARRAEYPPTDFSRTVTPLGKVASSGSVLQTTFDQFEDPGNAPRQPFGERLSPSPSLLPHSRQPLPGMNFPTDRQVPPAILGEHLGLLPGETATERLGRLMMRVGELEREAANLGQLNAEQTQLLKQRDDQLLLAIREIKVARKEVLTARDELERLRLQVKALQDKVQDAERDSAAVLQTMAPLLQKLLEPEAPPLPADGPEER